MPYLACESLQQRIDREGLLPIVDVLRIGMQVAAGLAAAHAQGLIHRDIKPANILLENGVERVKITDFGLARAVDDATLTQTGVIAGTPQYMSPEQARGEPSTPAATCSAWAACCTRCAPAARRSGRRRATASCAASPTPSRDRSASSIPRSPTGWNG